MHDPIGLDLPGVPGNNHPHKNLARSESLHTFRSKYLGVIISSNLSWLFIQSPKAHRYNFYQSS